MFSGNGYSYAATSTGSLYQSGGIISTISANSSLVFTFTSGNVTAVGGNFFITNVSDVFQAQPVTLTLSDGTVTNYTPSGVNDYRGFTSAIPITSLTIGAAGASLYSAADNLTVGTRIAPTATPEPGTLSLLGMGLMGGAGTLGVVRRRKTA